MPEAFIWIGLVDISLLITQNSPSFMLYPLSLKYLPRSMELNITNGMETQSLIIENFIPRKDASKMVIGTLQIAEAPI